MKYTWSLLLFLPFTVQSQSMDRLTYQFDSLFRSCFNPAEPGGAVLLVKDEQVIFQKGIGIADTKTRQPITTRTLFNTGSISKTFVAYGILQLESENKLSLDDDLHKYFPDFNNKGIAQKVKLKHLLTHTSGLPDSRKVKEEHAFYLVAKDEENFAPLKQTAELEFEPGTNYKYSNPAFNGLALVIEKVSGKKWQDYIRETIIQPAGMKTSTITDGPHPETGVAHAYIKNKQDEFEELDYGEEPTFAAAGNGGVWSSVEELWKYEQAIRKAVFLDANRIQRSRTVYPFPEWKGPVPSELGLSWFINRQPPGIAMIGHTGSQGGFISDYCWLPEQKLFYVLLCNRPQPIKEIRGKLFSILEQHRWLEQ
jgi:CubicO group peptidase (beta-lactamase class C family)